VRGRARIGAVLLVAAVAAGTWLASQHAPPAFQGAVLVADFHVHPFPGDGALTVRQLQREAVRRGIDVIALTGHNNQAGWRFATAVGDLDDDPVIVLPGQEVTAPGFHIAAIGIPRTVDWNRDARAVIEEVHALGGAVIASHPVEASWTPRDPATLALLDGVEVAHPERGKGGDRGRQLDAMFAEVQRANPRVSAIGSSDFHMNAPLGRCRTYVFADERSAAGVIRAVRTGRTVAEDAEGRLIGPPDLVARVTPDVRARRTDFEPAAAEKACALLALLGLTLISSARGRSDRA
jgi:hypothetical protein